MRYKRIFIQNSCVHLVVVTYNRNPILIKNIDLLRESFKNAKSFYDFEIFAICVLPEHFHLILNPKDINEYPKIITAIKYYFSKKFNCVGVETPTYNNSSNSRTKQNNIFPPTYGYKNKGEKGIWQRRYFEHTIINEDDLHKHLDYIHYNPVKHEYVQRVKDWEFSSFDKFVNMNNYEINWGSANDIKHLEKLDYD